MSLLNKNIHLLSSSSASSSSLQKDKLNELLDTNYVNTGKILNKRCWNLAELRNRKEEKSKINDTIIQHSADSNIVVSYQKSEQNNNKSLYIHPPHHSNHGSSAVVSQVDIAKNKEPFTANNVKISNENIGNNKKLIQDDEVESNINEGGKHELFEESEAEISNIQKNPTNKDDDDPYPPHITHSSLSLSSFSTNLPVLATTEPISQQQFNLKPILKRKDSLKLNKQTLQNISILPPPILKKRDSCGGDSTIEYSNSNLFPVGNAGLTNQQPKPLSILKNRQTKSSYSFDDTHTIVGSLTDTLSSLTDDKTVSTYHLKPILKKKSWSTEEKVASNGGPNCGGCSSSTSTATNETVKGILKSTSIDKSTSSSSNSVSSKNSILDDSVSYSNTNTCTTQQARNCNTVILKSILKSSLNKNRSTSLSPCTSTDSLIDNFELVVDRTSSSLPHNNNNINLKSAFRKRTSLDNSTSSTSIQLFDYAINKRSNGDIDPHHNCETSVSVINQLNTTTTIKPILKASSKNSFDSHDDSDSGDDNCSLSSNNKFAQSSIQTAILMNPSVDMSSTESNNTDSIGKQKTEKFESRMASPSSSNVTLRATTNEPKARPKSCFVSSSEINNSISERLALLKQNGEQSWKNRLQKEENVQKEDSNVIANRLSSLMESQSQWRNRIPEKDAKQFTVTSKLNQTNSKLSDDKVILRETPKRLGMRGSSLSEKKLGAISSKLNTVLSKDKSPFSFPIKSSVKNESQKPELTSTNLFNETSKQQQPTIITNILKPDDEESFGSFFGLDNSTLEQILNQPPLSASSEPQQPSSSFDSLESTTSSIKLLSENKKTRIQAPKRRAASDKNPAKLLARTPIIVNSYQTSQNSIITTNEQFSISTNTTNNASTKDNSKFAISALAGLASTEDFKSVANKLRNSGSTNNNLTRNDSWRTYDLKNSIQSKMLILVKGRRKAHTRLIEPNWQSLNEMDSFILVTKENIFVYIGRFSNIIERTKCMEIAEMIRKRKDLCFRSSTNEVTLIDCQNESDQLSLYNKLLPLLKELNFSESDRNYFEKMFYHTVTDINLDEDDEFYEESINYSNLVYMVIFEEKSDSTEKVELKPVESYCGRSPRHQILEQDKALIFDYGSEMYVWLGKTVSNILRKKAMEAAKELWLKGYDYSEYEYNPFGEKIPIKSDKRPDWSWFIRVNQNMEPILFKDKFFNWPAFTLTRSEKKKSQRSITSNITEKKHKIVKKDLSAELNLFPVDVENDMIKNVSKVNELILECVPLGRGAGDTIKDEDGLSVKVISLDMQCFYIDESGDRVKLDENERNFLCSGESYYIRWKYRLTRISRNLKTGGESRFSEQHGGRDRVCYFVWQGKDAKNTKRGLTALNAIEKLRVEGASQTYVEHGNEDPVFLRIFQGSLVIQMGKRSQIAINRRYRMFLLNDTVPNEEFMVELDCSFKNLRSRMSYMFINPNCSKNIYIWHGCKTNESKHKKIRNFVKEKLLNFKPKEFGFYDNKVQYEIIELNEGNENKQFIDIFHISNSTSPDSTLKRCSKSNLHRDIYFSLMDDPRPYDFTPRLFHFITSSDKIFEAVEIVPSYLPPKSSNIVVNYPFVQDDLYEKAKSRPTFFLFDAEYEVFLWESKYPFFICNNKTKNSKSGKHDSHDDLPRMIDIENEIQSESNTTTGFMSQLWLAERKCALETTLAYCYAKHPSEPPKSYVISAGLEPDAFCELFPTWTYYDNVAKLHIQDGRKPGEQILVQEMLSQIQDINQLTYSYEELKRRPLPEGINILCLESYLDDEEFEKVFSMNREEFCSLPTWKQKIIKQEKELF